MFKASFFINIILICLKNCSDFTSSIINELYVSGSYTFILLKIKNFNLDSHYVICERPMVSI